MSDNLDLIKSFNELKAWVVNALTNEQPYFTGFIPDADPWVYVNAVSFKIAGVDRTSRFPVGTKIRCKQGAGFLYFYVVAAAFSTDTTVTITGGSDYSLANASITDNAYSYENTPQGFPQWFNYAPTLSGWSVNPSFSANFSIVGRLCTVNILFGGGGTSNATTMTISSPLTSGGMVCNGSAGIAGGYNGTYPFVYINNSSSTINVGVFGGAAAWLNTGGKFCNLTISYMI